MNLTFCYVLGYVQSTLRKKDFENKLKQKHPKYQKNEEFNKKMDIIKYNAQHLVSSICTYVFSNICKVFNYAYNSGSVHGDTESHMEYHIRNSFFYFVVIHKGVIRKIFSNGMRHFLNYYKNVMIKETQTGKIPNK